ncbi:DUF3281 family protein [Francisella tularensis subsp. novicida]|uniref:Bacterial lipoprotein FTN_1103 n=2 Tax=Francisella tularensis TaxID=263 RepID=L1103_FRATN|nr:DUF3281 family protein [Francisella tularensis]A0Q6X4.1 RecName: Full=Bacterial lipoprotein FTN_1103; Short=BLP; Flags: Precursor [Francisella tularensis subsp. novicida U112]ABK89989.1 protein of unknown function [Francisella tularensis subsp. novicida U112]AJI60442.1 hypothetical protein AW25_905 [Francisella tularensis subsp. novicida U112]EDX19511.1 lipoprotein, putative [Francisella tularensis subsp. novicida FTE]MBK2035561.1 DUF3281 family protein [Francisella tularensis subsp. novici
MKYGNLMMTKKKLLIGMVTISGIVILGSCGKTETVNELLIVDQCNDVRDLCRLELANAQVSRYTNFLGKTIKRLQSQTPLRDIQGTVTWNASAGTSLADNSDVQSELGLSCQDDNCTANSNSTAYTLPVGSNTISVSGTVTVDGKTIDLATDVPALVINTSAAGSSVHVFPTELEGNLTLQDLVDSLNQGRHYAHATFSADGSNLKIQCDPGYVWLDDINPEYGGQSSAASARSVAMVSWVEELEEFRVDEFRFLHFDMSSLTLNGVRLGNHVFWEMGCWPT